VSDLKQSTPVSSPTDALHPGEPANPIVIAEPVDFDSEPLERIARLVCLLREAAAHGQDVHWTGRCSDQTLTRALTHLPPPRAPLDTRNETAWLTWRASYRLGLFYSRSGPDFRVIQDRRAHRARPARIVVGDARLIAALDTCRTPTDFVATGIEKAVRHLAAADLVLVVGEAAVTLPYRLPAWPVPAYSV